MPRLSSRPTWEQLSREERASLARVRPWIGRVLDLTNSPGTRIQVVFTGDYRINPYATREERLRHLAYFRFVGHGDYHWREPETGMQLSKLRGLPDA